MSDTIIPVELGPRRYEVRIGECAPETIVNVLAGAFGPSTTGVALLVDGGLAAHARTQALVAALVARLPGVSRLDQPLGAPNVWPGRHRVGRQGGDIRRQLGRGHSRRGHEVVSGLAEPDQRPQSLLERGQVIGRPCRLLLGPTAVDVGGRYF